MPELSLDSLTLTDTDPRQTIRAAASAGFDLVSLWTIAPPIYPRQLLTREMEVDCAAILADCGIAAHSIEAFDLTTMEAVREALPVLEMGARLGGKVVLALHFANTDRAEAVEVLAFLAERAAELGLGVNLEPVAMGQTSTLSEAAALIHDAGVDAGILFDTYHFARVGGRPADLDAMEDGLIRYVQVCDGFADVPRSDWIAESLEERLYPGDGEFGLRTMVQNLPRDIPWAVETPSLRRVANGLSPDAQARQALATMQRLLA